MKTLKKIAVFLKKVKNVYGKVFVFHFTSLKSPKMRMKAYSGIYIFDRFFYLENRANPYNKRDFAYFYLLKIMGREKKFKNFQNFF